MDPRNNKCLQTNQTKIKHDEVNVIDTCMHPCLKSFHFGLPLLHTFNTGFLEGKGGKERKEHYNRIKKK